MRPVRHAVCDMCPTHATRVDPVCVALWREPPAHTPPHAAATHTHTHTHTHTPVCYTHAVQAALVLVTFGKDTILSAHIFCMASAVVVR